MVSKHSRSVLSTATKTAHFVNINTNSSIYTCDARRLTGFFGEGGGSEGDGLQRLKFCLYVMIVIS